MRTRTACEEAVEDAQQDLLAVPGETGLFDIIAGGAP